MKATLASRAAALWRNLLRRNRVERDLDDEMRAILDLLVDEKRRAGLAPEEARRAAALALGPVAALKDQVRDARQGAFLETVWQDVRYAARVLQRGRLFAATATLSLAIGIGASTSIFTLVNGLLLRAAAGVADPDGLVDVVRLERNRGPGIAPVSFPTLRDLRERATGLQAVYGYGLDLPAVSLRVGDTAAESVFANLVTTNFFTTLGVRPAAGRLLDATDSEAPDASPVVVLSHAFWTRRFQADPAVIGSVVRINGRPLTLVGVAGESFRGVGVTAPDLWMPVSMAGLVMPDAGARVLLERGMPLLMAGARLAPGVSRHQASAEVAAIGAALQREHPSTDGRTAPRRPGIHEADGGFVWSVETASPIPYGVRPLAAGFLGLLMALVSTILIIACANLAGVLLSRAVSRRQEMAVRTALGGGRRRLMRQLLTETLLLFAMGGAAGLLLARLLLRLLASLLPAFDVPVNLSAPLDARVVAFALGVSFVAALLSGLAPALHGSRADVVTALKDDSQGPTDRLRLRQAFVVAQIACSILLVVVAMLLVRGVDRQASAARGFDATGVDVASVDLTQAGYTSASGLTVAKRLLDAVRALPEVEDASLADHPPEPGGWSLGTVTVPGLPEVEDAAFLWTLSTPRHFHTVRIPVLKGRDFTDADLDGTEPVMILGQTAARRLFGADTDPVGRYVTVRSNLVSRDGRPSPPRPIRIVGIVGDVQFGRSAPLMVYVPLSYRFTPRLTILARARTPGAGRGLKLREGVAAIDPNLPVLGAGPLASRGSGPVETQLRIAASVAATVALIGLWLAGVGVYGVAAYAVAQRTREIGIRLSLGATAGQVAWLVLGHGLRLVALGSAVGLFLAIVAGRLLAQGRLGLPAIDPIALTGAMALFAGICLVACLVPVRRATRINAVEALRYE
jgi:predicted permease